MKETDILYETGNYWVARQQGLYVVYKNGVTHSTSCDDVGYQDISIAIARANYLSKREAINNNLVPSVTRCKATEVT